MPLTPSRSESSPSLTAPGHWHRLHASLAPIRRPTSIRDSNRPVTDSADEPERDDDWDAKARHETPLGRLDRNWADLLQELRVVQTGVQLLTGFLLTLPFQDRFARLPPFSKDVYLGTVATSVAATGFLIAPVSVHRLLFRMHARRQMVTIAHRLALTGMFLLGCSVTGVVLLIFDVILGRTAGLVAAGVTLAMLVALWVGIPTGLRLLLHHDRGR
ncbi:MAG: hypothetical protein JWN95_85 [Frankiales bacterium]|nr:hypothetical protein [Frankiales bacterium]